MGSLSLYRGNLHRVSNAPREWLMPPRKVSLKDFKSLLLTRQESLRRLLSPTSNPNPNPNPNSNSIAQQQQQPKHEFVGDNGCSKQKHPQITTSKAPPPQLQATSSSEVAKEAKFTAVRVEKDHLQQQHQRVVRCAKDQSGSDGDTRVEKRKRSRDALSYPDFKPDVARVVNGCDHAVARASQDLKQVKQLAAVPAPVNMPVEITKNLELLSVKEKEKKKRDLQHNLEVLNARKHNLVQMLKQVLNTEEEMKRRISVKATGFAAPVRQLMEGTTDLGSNPGQVVHRVQADFYGDMQEESEDISNNNTHARQFHRKRSTSPSASSPHRKVAHSPRQQIVVPPYNRQGSGVSGNTQTSSSVPVAGVVASSPSRFPPPLGHQGHPGNLPPLSLSGTHCTTSSPSPAGSGGTSVFREARITSPSWN